MSDPSAPGAQPTNTSVSLDRAPQHAFDYPTPATPEEAFQTIGRLRKDARDEINRLIGFLDKTDDYVSRELELEDGNDEPPEDDEPSLGFLDCTDQRRIMDGLSGDREQEHDGREPLEDDEESDNGIADLDALLEQIGGFFARGEVQ